MIISDNDMLQSKYNRMWEKKVWKGDSQLSVWVPKHCAYLMCQHRHMLQRGWTSLFQLLDSSQRSQCFGSSPPYSSEFILWNVSVFCVGFCTLEGWCPQTITWVLCPMASGWILQALAGDQRVEGKRGWDLFSSLSLHDYSIVWQPCITWQP